LRLCEEKIRASKMLAYQNASWKLALHSVLSVQIVTMERRQLACIMASGLLARFGLSILAQPIAVFGCKASIPELFFD
jgi:hypothetical protein